MSAVPDTSVYMKLTNGADHPWTLILTNTRLGDKYFQLTHDEAVKDDENKKGQLAWGWHIAPIKEKRIDHLTLIGEIEARLRDKAIDIIETSGVWDGTHRWGLDILDCLQSKSHGLTWDSRGRNEIVHKLKELGQF